MTESTEYYKDCAGECDNTYRILTALLTGVVLERYKTQIAAFHEKFPDRTLNIDETEITLQSSSREETVHFLKCFGGTWKKSLEEYQKDAIRYDQELAPIQPNVSSYYNFKLSIRSAAPPPSCKIEEYEEEVPAQVVKKRRIVCPKGELEVRDIDDEIIEPATPVTAEQVEQENVVISTQESEPTNA